LFALLNSIEPRAINWEYVSAGENEEQIENNAKYALSVARRIGATIFCVWEDIRDVKPKMIMTILAALKKVAEEGPAPRKKSLEEAGTTTPKATTTTTFSSGSKTTTTTTASQPKTEVAAHNTEPKITMSSALKARAAMFK